MKCFKFFLLGLVFVLFFLSSDTAFAWDYYQTLGSRKISLQFDVLARFDPKLGFWASSKVFYGVSEKVDLFAELGYVKPVEAGQGGVGYGLGLKWWFLFPKDFWPGWALFLNHRVAYPGGLSLGWTDLILETSFPVGSADYYLIFGFTFPKQDEPGYFLGGGFITPLADSENISLSLGIRYNTQTAKQDGYFSIESGLNYYF